MSHVATWTISDIGVRCSVHRAGRIYLHRLRRLAREGSKFFHKARRPCDQWGVRAAYYLSDMTNALVAVYATLEAAEEDLQS